VPSIATRLTRVKSNGNHPRPKRVAPPWKGGDYENQKITQLGDFLFCSIEEVSSAKLNGRLDLVWTPEVGRKSRLWSLSAVELLTTIVKIDFCRRRCLVDL
jgi:hypothetical protein